MGHPSKVAFGSTTSRPRCRAASLNGRVWHNQRKNFLIPTWLLVLCVHLSQIRIWRTPNGFSTGGRVSLFKEFWLYRQLLPDPFLFPSLFPTRRARVRPGSSRPRWRGWMVVGMRRPSFGVLGSRFQPRKTARQILRSSTWYCQVPIITLSYLYWAWAPQEGDEGRVRCSTSRAQPARRGTGNPLTCASCVGVYGGNRTLHSLL